MNSPRKQQCYVALFHFVEETKLGLMGVCARVCVC